MHQAEDQLTKITLNLFKDDVEYLRAHHSWTVEIRNAVHTYVNDRRRKAASLRAAPLLRSEHD